MRSNMIALDWRLTWREAETSADNEWIKATVPGAVQRDWGQHAKLPDPHEANFPGPYEWMENVWWVYRAQLPSLVAGAGQTVLFIAEGVDYRYRIALNGVVIAEHEGMFSAVTLDLGPVMTAGTLLEIRIAPVPKAPGQIGRNQARESCKPAMSYGWDWHPRLVPSGIWRPCTLQVVSKARITKVEVQPTVNDALDTGNVQVSFVLDAATACNIRCELIAPDGQRVNSIETKQGGTFHLCARNVQLWWPVGQGIQPLYTVCITQKTPDGTTVFSLAKHIGFRNIRLVMNEGTWEQPVLFPKSRSAEPATFEVNGRRIFAKGTNWITPRLFAGEITREDFAHLIQLAVEAHFNCLRIWGGGIVNPTEFYDLCDKAGLLIIQEFPLACNDYPDKPSYLEVLDQESQAIIRNLRHHASLACWSGGNELFNAWSGMTGQSHALRLLNRNCYELDRNRPFLPTMPVEGIGHGPYTYYDKERGWEVTRIMREASNTAYTEFGQPGASPLEVIEAIIPANQRWPIQPNTRWTTHHALAAFYAESWLGQNILDHTFGPSPDLCTLVNRSQWLQAYGYQMIYEESRRQWPHCSMALNWCFNEIWPCAANNSLLAWPAIPKPAYFAVQASCRPALVSATLERFSWQQGQTFTCQLWLLNDSPTRLQTTTITAHLMACGETITLGTWNNAATEALANACGPTLSATIPTHWKGETFQLTLASNRPELAHAYKLHLGKPYGQLTFAQGNPDIVQLNQ